MYLLRLENRVCNSFNQFFKKILCNLLILLFGPPQFIKGDPHRIYVETNSHHIWVWMTVINQIAKYIKYLLNRHTTVEEDLKGDTHLWPKDGAWGSYIRTRDIPIKVSSLILLGETLSNSRLRFLFPNCHWLKHRSKSHRVSHGGLCFVGLSLEANQPSQDSSGLPSQSTLLLRQK